MAKAGSSPRIAANAAAAKRVPPWSELQKVSEAMDAKAGVVALMLFVNVGVRHHRNACRKHKNRLSR